MRAATASEFQDQMAVCQWWASYCKTKKLDERLLVAVPNGSFLAGDATARARQMSKLKASGLRVGYPDLLLDLPRIGAMNPATELHPIFHGMRIEMKRKNGPKPSPEQASYHELLRQRGYNVIVAKGSEEAISAIKAYVERLHVEPERTYADLPLPGAVPF